MDFKDLLLNKLNLADSIDTDISNEILSHANKEFSDIIQRHKDEINSLIVNDSQFIESLENILNMPIIALNIVTMQYDYEDDKRRSDDTFESFLTNVRKLFEFLLKLLLQYKNIQLNEHYMSFDHDVRDLIEHYIVHVDEIGKDFYIDDTKAKNQIAYHDTISNINILIKSDYKVAKISKEKKILALKYHFGFHNDWYYKVYYKIPKSKSTKSTGGGSTYKRLKYGKRASYDENRLSRQKNESDNHYERNETRASLNADYHPQILDKHSLSKIKNKVAHYTKNLQSKARASRIGKTNNKLPSDYNIPLADNLGAFIQQCLLNKYISNDDFDTTNENICSEFKDKTILFSILSGYSVDQLLDMLLFNQVNIDKKNQLILYKNDVKYAKLLDELSEYTHQRASISNSISIEMPENLNRIFSFLKTNIYIFLNTENFISRFFKEIFQVKIKNTQYKFDKKNIFDQFYNVCEQEIIFKYKLFGLEEDVQTKQIQDIFDELKCRKHFFDIITKSISIYLKVKVDSYSKNFQKISLKINHLDNILLHTYYRKSKTKSNVHMLFLKELNYNDYGAMSYATVSDQLYVQSAWLFRLQQILKIEKSLNIYTHSTQNNPIERSRDLKGSPFYILPGKFKNFFYTLDSSIRQFKKDSFIHDSLTMIYLRYAFSILLFTRDNQDSCNLSNICYDPPIFSISEKNTDEHSSIRIVPLVETTIQFITYFNQIKSKYNVKRESIASYFCP